MTSSWNLGEFLERPDPFLAALPTTGRLGVEVRNREFLHEKLLAVLRKHRAALVLSEVRGMPHPADVVERLDVITTDFFYARLIGDRQAVERKTKTFDKVALDKTESLGRWVHLVRVLGTSADGYLYVNNHYAGHGPATIRELRTLVEARLSPPRELGSGRPRQDPRKVLGGPGTATPQGGVD